MDAHCFIAGLSSENAEKERFAKKSRKRGIKTLFRIFLLLTIELSGTRQPVRLDDWLGRTRRIRSGPVVLK